VSNPIYALISLILIFFITALFLLSIHIEFLAFIYIIVYLGAIAILFLFVLMMFNLKELQKAIDYSQSSSFLIFSLSFYLFLLYKFYYLLIHIFLSYVEYDAYINNMVVLRFKVLYSHSRNLYINFIQDLILDLGRALSE
jgi:NADH:ubiquinone oxidoreductase subunit 6 (subunit J)